MAFTIKKATDPSIPVLLTPDGSEIVVVTRNPYTAPSDAVVPLSAIGGAVASVYGRVGAVVAVSGDYTAALVPFAPAGGLSAVDVQAALVELDTEKQPAGSYATAAQGALADTAVQPADLAFVAFTGAYASLSGTPTLATVATSGAYGDLSGKPTLGTLAAFNDAPSNGSQYARLDGAWAVVSGGVTSVFTRTGAVVAANGDYTASQITNTPAGNIQTTTVQAALNELDTEKQPLDATLTAYAALAGAANKLPYFTGADAFALADFSAFGRSLVDDADAAAAIATLGVLQPPFTDTNALVKGSVDPTKLLRWEIDGLTAGATRVMTPPDQSILLAGQDFANLFTAHQTVTIATASAHGVTLKTSDDNATNRLLRFLDSANVELGYLTATGAFNVVRGTSTTNTFLGNNAGNKTASGTNNVFMGNSTGSSLTSGTNNFGLGVQALQMLTTGAGNVGIGTFACNKVVGADGDVGIGSSALLNATGANNIAIGGSAALALTTGPQNVAIGRSTFGSLLTGGFNVAVGDTAGVNNTGWQNTFLGAATGHINTTRYDHSIALGYGATVTATSQWAVGSTASPVTEAYFGRSVTAAAPSSFALNATGGSGTDIAGAALILAGGKPTGSGAGGSVSLQTAPAGATGTTLRTLEDKATWYGRALEIAGKSSTTSDRNIASIEFPWAVNTDASRTGQGIASAYYTTTKRECFRWEANSSGPLFGVLGAVASPQQTFGAATAGATYGATEQLMLQKCYDALRLFGFGT